MVFFIDLSKAFDTLNRNTLLDKLCHLEIRSVITTLEVTFLIDQILYFVTSFSQSTTISMGVPQWSILWPIIFLIYIRVVTRLSLGPVSRGNNGLSPTTSLSWIWATRCFSVFPQFYLTLYMLMIWTSKKLTKFWIFCISAQILNMNWFSNV